MKGFEYELPKDILYRKKFETCAVFVDPKSDGLDDAMARLSTAISCQLLRMLTRSTPTYAIGIVQQLLAKHG